MLEGMLGDSQKLRQLMGGPITELFLRLNGPSGPSWERAFKKFVRREMCWSPEHVTLKCLGETEASLNISPHAPFVIKDHFRTGLVSASFGPIRFATIGAGFHERFMSGSEDHPGFLEVRYFALEAGRLTDDGIRAEFGRGIKRLLEVNQFWVLLSKQGEGQKDGPLRVDGGTNFFYADGLGLEDSSVSARYENGWQIDAGEVTPHLSNPGSLRLFADTGPAFYGP